LFGRLAVEVAAVTPQLYAAEYVPAALQALLEGATLSECRKLVACVHRGESLGAPVVSVRRIIMQSARKLLATPRLAVAEMQASTEDPFVKYALRGDDGPLFETVRIPLEKVGRYSVCVSSQIGCALACDFCATGRLGLLRNLATWEILEQVRIVRDGLPKGSRVHGVVFQGMGEPLANIDAVLGALALLSDPCAYAVDARNITR
jgi:23S rRNA (adenine2503-C2)-methyltransferase